MFRWPSQTQKTRFLRGASGTSVLKFRAERRCGKGVNRAAAAMADDAGDGGGSSMGTLLRDKLVGSDLEPLHVELTE